MTCYRMLSAFVQHRVWLDSLFVQGWTYDFTRLPRYAGASATGPGRPAGPPGTKDLANTGPGALWQLRRRLFRKRVGKRMQADFQASGTKPGPGSLGLMLPWEDN